MKTRLNINNLLNERNIYLTINELNYIKEIIYKVNEFITKRDFTLNKNLKNNLTGLIIRKDRIKLWENGYNASKNELRIDISKWDIASVLEIACTNRNKKYPGVVMDEGIGYGLNAGITEYFSKCLSNKSNNYMIESLVAETLLKLNYDVVFYSYFYNNGSNLMLIDGRIKELMKYLDIYHNNYKKMNELISLNKDDPTIYELKCSNFCAVYYIIDILINIIDRSFIDEKSKYEMVSEFVCKFNSIVSFMEFYYLKDLKFSIKKSVKVYKR